MFGMLFSARAVERAATGQERRAPAIRILASEKSDAPSLLLVRCAAAC